MLPSTVKSARPARPLFLTAEKGTKRLPAGAHKIQFYAARFTTRFAQTNKTLLPRKTDFIDGLKAGETTATTRLRPA